VVCLAAALSVPATQAGADEEWHTTAEIAAPPSAPPEPSARETWIGADTTRQTAAIWSGVTWAPFGAIQEQGWRVRTVSGAGRYTYDGWTLVRGGPTPAHFKGLTNFSDIFVGYHVQVGALTLKPFAGLATAQHAVTPRDPVSPLIGRTIGVKLALDTWLSLGAQAWLNIDGSWTDVHETAAIKGRLGYRVWRDLSFGVEGQAVSDVNQESRRAGVFLRFSGAYGEVSIGGGVAGHSWLEMPRSRDPYASATVMGRF
jgi:Cellulose biosynthesis protein BcsS